MYIRRVDIKNYGPIEDCVIEPVFRDDGSPMPVIIAGQNGSGKTLVLTNIVDSIVELKEKRKNKKNAKKQLFKAAKKDYIKNGENEYLVNIKFTEKDIDEDIEYVDIATHNSEVFINRFKGISEKYVDDVSKFCDTGFYRNIVSENYQYNDDGVLLYFPTNRYYNPSWYNSEEFGVSFDLKDKEEENSIMKQNLLEELESWLLDVLLDKQLYEINTERKMYYKFVGNNKVAPVHIDEFVGYEGRNTNIINLINEVLKVIYDKKYECIEYARIGVSQKSNRRISVFIKEQNKDEFEIAPKFSHLSSGEVMILSLFATIIKEYDNKNGEDLFSLEDISGIVVVDEIDQNLHIKYVKEVLPLLINSFPKIQFILTSHSPFFLLGMKVTMGDELMYLNMPDGDLVEELESYNQIKECYKGFVELNEKEIRRINQIKTLVNDTTSFVTVITEKATDWKHMKNALNIFKEEGHFRDLEINFIEYDSDVNMGEGNLQILLNKLAHQGRENIVIGIFNGSGKIAKRLITEGTNTMSNNVFAFSIDKPKYRKENKNMCIEFLYQDKDLFTLDSKGRRLYLSNEFRELNGRHRKNHMINYVKTENLIGKITSESAVIIDDDVYNENEEKLSITKEQFAESILNRENGFEYVDVTGFAQVFNKIRDVIISLND